MPFLLTSLVNNAAYTATQYVEALVEIAIGATAQDLEVGRIRLCRRRAVQGKCVLCIRRLCISSGLLSYFKTFLHYFYIGHLFCSLSSLGGQSHGTQSRGRCCALARSTCVCTVATTRFARATSRVNTRTRRTTTTLLAHCPSTWRAEFNPGQ
jgi:hypothetical protein